MDKSNYLNYWDFQSDFLKIPAISKRLKNKTVKEKVLDLIKKYRSMIAHHTSYITDLENEINSLKRLVNCLKTDKIHYNNGFIAVNEIEKVEKVEKDGVVSYVVTLKSKSTIKFSNDFDWILKL